LIVSFAILSRLISPEQMGIIAVLTLVDSACVVIGTLSFPNAVVKFMAQHLSTDDKATAASIFYQALRVTFVLALPLAVAVYAAAPVLARILLQQTSYALYLQLLSLDIVVYAGLLPILNAAFLGLQRFKQQAIIFTVGSAIRQALIIGLIISLRSFLGLLIAWVSSDLIVSLASLLYLSRILGRPRFSFPLNRLFDYSWPLWLSDGVSFASQWFDRAILLVFVPLAAVGIYNVTLTAFSVVAGIGVVTANTLFPAFASMQHPDRRRELGSALKKSTRYLCFLMVPLSFGLFATARPALTLFVGPAYVVGTWSLMILSGTFGLTIVGISLSPMLLALGETRLASLSTLGALIISLLSAGALTPSLGIIGAATARAISMVAGLGLVVFFLKGKLRFEIDRDAAQKSIVAGIVMAIVVMGIEAGFYSKYLLPAYVLIGAFVYMAMLRLLKAVSREDIRFVREYMGPRLAFASDLLSIMLLPTAD
jgi:O-antigen/teichoic acid export membrane protein